VVVTTVQVAKLVEGLTAGVESEDLIVQDIQFDGKLDGI
jgi:hypothetical protein